MQSFIFGAGQEAKTPEELAKRRAVQDALAKAILGRTPQNVGEGLSQVGQALAFRMMRNQNDASEKAGRESADKAFSGVDVSSLFGGGAGYPTAVAAGASPTSGAATGTSAPFAGNVQTAIADAATRHGVDANAMSVIAQIESSGNPNAKNPSSSAGGLFQFIDDTAKQYGLQNKFDPVQASDAGARLMKDNAAYLGNILGRAPNVGELYLAHQQGAGGAGKLLANPNARAADIVGEKAVRLNGGNPNMTAGDFANIWMSKANKLTEGGRQQGVQVASLDPSIGLGPDPNEAEALFGPNADVSQADIEFAKQATGSPVQSPQPQSAPAVAPYDFTGNPQLSAGAGMPFQGGQAQPQQMASVQPQQQADPKTAIRDALLRQNDMMLGGALAPQGQAPQQVADASGSFPPAPTGQPFAGQQGGDARGAMVQKLMQAAQNPWMNDSQRAIVNALLQNQMQQADPMRQLQMQKAQLEIDALRAKPQTEYGFTTLPDGTVLRTDKRSGNAEPIYSAGQKPTSDMQEYEFARTQGYQGTFADYQQAMKKAGATNVSTTVNGEPGDGALRKKLDEKTGENWAAYQEAGVNSAGTMQDMQMMDELIKLAPQGPIQGRLAEAFPGVSSAGDAFQSIVKRVAPTLRAPGSGSTSDIEYDGMLRSLPALRNTPEANTMISQIMKAKSQINMERAEVISQYRQGNISAAQAERQIAEVNKRSIMTPEMHRALAGIGGADQKKQAPEGVDPSVWGVMTPEERALWQN